MTRAGILTILLAFNGGFVDTVGLVGLHGLFLAHVTGNYVSFAAALALGGHGAIAKALALPEFMAAIALSHLAARMLARDNVTALRVLFGVQILLLFAFFLIAVMLGPFAGDSGAASLLAAACGIAAMAMQNVLLTGFFPDLPPTTFMSGNTMRSVIDITDLFYGVAPEKRAVLRIKLAHGLLSLFCFVSGCGIAAILFHLFGFWCLLMPLLAGAASAAVAIGGEMPEARFVH